MSHPFLLALSIASVVSAQDLSCKHCRGGTRKCVPDLSIQILTEQDCLACLKSGSHWTWPCNVEGLCWCWDSSKPRYKPPLSSGYEEAKKKPCDIFTEEMFDVIAPNAIHPYTYDGLCEVIDMLNDRYDEKLFMMGTKEQQRQEWAAFIGHTTHESAQYTAAREALVCARTTERNSGTYCKPCKNENFDWGNRYCEVSVVSNGRFYEDYCDKIVTPPYGCVCGPTVEVDKEDLKGLINPNAVFFGRGAIQISWNANYLKASQVLAESGETLCTQPDLVATEPKYAWGTALWFWLFSKPPGQETTCHIQSLEGNFGGSLNVINGGLECPADPHGYHAEAIVMRLRYYCIAASVLGVKRLLDLDGCEGLSSKFEECVMTGYCPECNDFYAEPSPAPSKPPSEATPTAQPMGFRSWANDNWMNDLKRRDSSAEALLSTLSPFITLLAWLHYSMH
ncbi:hypothetical protein ACHAWF_007356 [Thalassiosira exigua]